MNTVSKQAAAALGLNFYFTDIPCKNGHVSERRVKSGTCVECGKIRGAKWYADNLSQAKATRARWRVKNKDKDNADIAAYQTVHKEHLYAMNVLWAKKNPDMVKATHHKSVARNKAAVLLQGSDWRKRNRDKVNAKKSMRIASQLKATPSWANEFIIKEIYHLAKLRKMICGGHWHVDHIVPIRSELVCGLHCESNLRVVPAKVNQLKSNRYWPDMPC